MEHAAFALATVLPVFFVILLGALLRRRGIIDARFVTVSSRLVFTVSLRRSFSAPLP
jgi:predicted permease